MALLLHHITASSVHANGSAAASVTSHTIPPGTSMSRARPDVGEEGEAAAHIHGVESASKPSVIESRLL